MPAYRILIVDDQRDIRNLLCSTIESLGTDYQAVGVPSGEEALFVIATQNIDILVLDVILPGISGLELLAKARQRFPQLKVVMVTGVSDLEVQRTAAEAGVDAFFLKPLEAMDFRDTILRLLGAGEIQRPESEDFSSGVPEQDLSQRLISLHQELGAIHSRLMDDRGRIHAQVGGTPIAPNEPDLIPLLLVSFQAGIEIAGLVGSDPPNNLFYYAGRDYDLIFSHVCGPYALLEIVPPLDLPEDHGKVVRAVYAGANDFCKLLQRMGVSPGAEVESSTQAVEIEGDVADDEPLFDALFQEMESNVPEVEEANVFWDSVTEGETRNRVPNDDTLTYDQAQQLGLTPEDGDE